MLNASTEIPAAPRVNPRQPQARDVKQPPDSFSSLVGDDAAAKSDASRARPARDTEAARSSSDKTPAPQQAGDKPVKAEDKADEEIAIQPAPVQTAPVAAIVEPTLLIAAAAAAPAEPVAVAVPVVAASSPAAAVTAAPAPLAIAATGIATAKAATTKGTDATAATDADQTAAEAAPPAGEVVAPPATHGEPKPAATEPLAVKVATGFAVTAKPPESAQPDTSAKTGVKAEAKTETKTGDATPPDAAIADDMKPPPLHTAVAHDQRPASTPSADANANGQPSVLPQPAPHTAAAVSPVAQLTATVATAAPVPLNGLAVELASRAQSGASRFDIRLDPAELGRIDVRIDIDRHGQVTSHLTVEKPETLAMLRQDSPQLQRALNEAGLKTADGALQFTLGDQSQPRQHADRGEQQAQRFIIRDDETVAPTMPVRGYGRMPAARSGVDISV